MGTHLSVEGESLPEGGMSPNFDRDGLNISIMTEFRFSISVKRNMKVFFFVKI